jgi:hypothetical protein
MNSPFTTALWLNEHDWLCTVEFLNDHDPEAQEETAEMIGYLLAYARMTNTRSLALLADPNGLAYEILFSFHSPEEKSPFLELIRSNQELGNDYIENDLMTPTVEEIQEACPLATVLPQRVMARAALVANAFCIPPSARYSELNRTMRPRLQLNCAMRTVVFMRTTFRISSKEYSRSIFARQTQHFK